MKRSACGSSWSLPYDALAASDKADASSWRRMPAFALSNSRAVDTLVTERPKTAAMEYVIRFFIGGLIVSIFAALGDIFRPKSFAGLFDAAPSVALATL